jgi:hypothetical protein
MDEMRWPRNVLEWVPQEKCKQGQLGWGWRDDIMEAKDLADEDCCRREEWRLGWRNGDSCKIICIYIYIYIFIKYGVNGTWC